MSLSDAMRRKRALPLFSPTLARPSRKSLSNEPLIWTSLRSRQSHHRTGETMSESSETPSPEKPRRITQFKPGQSGNPLGRPKRKVDMSVALNKALNDNILVTNLGKTRTGLEAVVQSIVDRVLQGDSKGIVALMNLLNKAKLFKPVPNPTRLTGVVVAPPAYRRDSELGIQDGYYPVGNGRGFLDPVTKGISKNPPKN